MRIHIYNSLLFIDKISDVHESFDINKINNLNFQKIDKLKFPVFKLLNRLNNFDSLYETILVSANDVLVDLFLKKKIRFYDIYKILDKVLSLNEYKKFKFLKPNNLDQIIKLSEIVRLKTISLSVQSKI